MSSWLLLLSLAVQQPDTLRMKARIDSLKAIAEAARAAMHRADSIRHAENNAQGAGTLDTVTVEGINIVARGKSIQAIAALFEAVLREHEAGIGIGHAIKGATFLVQDADRIGALAALHARPDHYYLQLPRRNKARRTAIWQSMRGVATSRLSPELRAWLDGATLELNPAKTRMAAFRELKLRQISSVGQCVAGAQARCLDALGLREPGPLFTNRYTRAELRDVFISTHGKRGAMAMHPCLAASDAEACLKALNPARLVPLNINARMSFLDELMAAADAGALPRLQAARGPVTEQLSALAPGGLERAAASWRAAVLAAPPKRLSASLATAASTLVWILILAAIGMRSTRWRLG